MNISIFWRGSSGTEIIVGNVEYEAYITLLNRKNEKNASDVLTKLR